MHFINILEAAQTETKAPQSFGDSWTAFWQRVGDFWIGIPEDGGLPYLAVVAIALAFLVIGFFVVKLINKGVRKLLKLGKKQFVNERTIKNFIANVISVTLNILLVLGFIAILGVKLTGIATIFSSAILAVGLSLQDVIGNFASGLIILTSKPFIVGDYVEFAGVSGTVTDVKFLATYLETPNKQIIVVPNKTVTTSNIMNYSTNPTRRINLIVGVDYTSDIELVKNTLLSVARDDSRVLTDPVPTCYLANINEFSLDFSLRCFVSNADYWDVLFDFNEKVITKFREKNINIPFKTVTMFQGDKQVPLKEVLEDNKTQIGEK